MKSFKQFLSFLTEKKDKGTVVAAFGRFNPPTIGHEKLLDAMDKIASKEKADEVRVYGSHSQDPKKNPLDFKNKMMFLSLVAANSDAKIMTKSTVNNPFEMVIELAKEGFSNIIVIAGSDRIAEYQKAEKYALENGATTYKVMSAGERDPDADGAEGMSASKMRKAAADGDFESFKLGSGHATDIMSHNLYTAVRKGMGIK